MYRQDMMSPEFFNSENVSISNLLEFSTPQLNDELKRLFSVNTENVQAIQKPAVCRRSLFPERRPFTNLTNLNKNKNSLNEIMEDFQKNGIDYEYCPQDEDNTLSTYYRKANETTPEIASSIFNSSKPRKRLRSQKPSSKYCVFCKNNERPPDVYLAHVFRDKNNTLVCPFLRQYVCPLCSATGDNAHTIKYCPKTGSSWSRNHSCSESSV